MDVFTWLRRRFCRHRFKKHWSREKEDYVQRCVRCGKVR